MNLSFTPIGHVKNAIREPREGFSKKNETSILDLLPQFAEGLYRLDDSSYIDVLFYFDRSDSYQLQGPIFTGEVKGVFASRSPRRPNGIGVTTVRLQKVERNKVWVSGLDAMDGTPILDIKPGSMPPTTETAEAETLRRERLRNNPRFDVIRAIKSEDLEELLLGAGQMHGHFLYRFGPWGKSNGLRHECPQRHERQYGRFARHFRDQDLLCRWATVCKRLHPEQPGPAHQGPGANRFYPDPKKWKGPKVGGPGGSPTAY